MNIDINEVIKRCELLKMVNNEKYVTVSELAKELNVRKTELMDFIVKNKDCFVTDCIAPSNKNIGLCILEVYHYGFENPNTMEYAVSQTVKYSSTIFIDNIIDDDGKVKGHQVIEDIKEYSPHKEYLWRNTKHKLDTLHQKGILTSTAQCNHILCIDFKEKLKDMGWTWLER